MSEVTRTVGNSLPCIAESITSVLWTCIFGKQWFELIGA